MASAAIYDLVHDHLEANFATAPLSFENELWSAPDTPAAYVFVEIFGDFYSQESIGAPGSNLWRESAAVELHVFVPNDTGSREARVLARELADLFREREDLPGLRVMDMSIGAGEPGDEKANYWRMTVSVRLERDD